MGIKNTFHICRGQGVYFQKTLDQSQRGKGLGSHLLKWYQKKEEPAKLTPYYHFHWITKKESLSSPCSNVFKVAGGILFLYGIYDLYLSFAKDEILGLAKEGQFNPRDPLDTLIGQFRKELYFLCKCLESQDSPSFNKKIKENLSSSQSLIWAFFKALYLKGEPKILITLYKKTKEFFNESGIEIDPVFITFAKNDYKKQKPFAATMMAYLIYYGIGEKKPLNQAPFNDVALSFSLLQKLAMEGNLIAMNCMAKIYAKNSFYLPHDSSQKIHLQLSSKERIKNIIALARNGSKSAQDLYVKMVLGHQVGSAAFPLNFTWSKEAANEVVHLCAKHFLLYNAVRLKTCSDIRFGYTDPDYSFLYLMCTQQEANDLLKKWAMEGDPASFGFVVSKLAKEKNLCEKEIVQQLFKEWPEAKRAYLKAKNNWETFSTWGLSSFNQRHSVQHDTWELVWYLHDLASLAIEQIDHSFGRFFSPEFSHCDQSKNLYDMLP